MLFALPFTSLPFPLLELASFSPWQPTAHSSHSLSCSPTILTTHAQSPKQTRTIPFLECHCRCSVIICTKTTKKSYCQWIYTRLACLHGEKLEGCKQQGRNQFSYSITHLALHMSSSSSQLAAAKSSMIPKMRSQTPTALHTLLRK